MRPNVVAPTVTSPTTSIQDRALQMATAQDIYDLAKEIFDEELYELDDPESIVALDPYYDPNSGQTYNERVRHELRMHRWTIAEVGIAGGRVELFKLWGTIKLELEVFSNRLKQEQPGCEWKLVAYSLERNPGHTMSAAINSKGKFSTANLNAAAESGIDIETGKSSPVGLNRTQAFVQRADPVAQLAVLYADVSMGLLRCPNIEIEPDWQPTMATYARERALRFMSQGMRKSRLRCERLFRKCYPKTEETFQPEKPAAPARQQPRHAPTVPRTELTDEELMPKITELLGQKVPPSHIAKRLKVPGDRVRALVKQMALDEARTHAEG